MIDNKVFMLTLRPPPSAGAVDEKNPLAATKTFIKPNKDDGLDLKNKNKKLEGGSTTKKKKDELNISKEVLNKRLEDNGSSTKASKDEFNISQEVLNRRLESNGASTKPSKEDLSQEESTVTTEENKKDSEERATTAAMSEERREETAGPKEDSKETSSPAEGEFNIFRIYYCLTVIPKAEGKLSVFFS